MVTVIFEVSSIMTKCFSLSWLSLEMLDVVSTHSAFHNVQILRVRLRNSFVSNAVASNPWRILSLIPRMRWSPGIFITLWIRYQGCKWAGACIQHCWSSWDFFCSCQNFFSLTIRTGMCRSGAAHCLPRHWSITSQGQIIQFINKISRQPVSYGNTSNLYFTVFSIITYIKSYINYS